MNYKNKLIKLPQNRVWRTYLGGRVLDELVGKSAPCDSHYPEDWVGSVTVGAILTHKMKTKVFQK